jgi:APA family basic amino acid/polyamine antiporter
LLNLILGLSRVVLAMSRRSDLPSSLAVIDRRGVPLRATLTVAAVIASLVLLGDVKLAWSFSATTVLIYYALTNLCAIRVDSAERIFPIAFAWCGLLSCCGLVLFIPWPVLAAVAGLVALGMLVQSLGESNKADQ